MFNIILRNSRSINSEIKAPHFRQAIGIINFFVSDKIGVRDSAMKPVNLVETAVNLLY